MRPDGSIGPGRLEAWFIPGRFRFCPHCKSQPASQARGRTKLAGLLGEGEAAPEFFGGLGTTAHASTPEAFAERIAGDREKFAAVIESADITGE